MTKTIIISDLHLGTKRACADKLLTFLKLERFDKLILNGDILDIDRLKQVFYLPPSHVSLLYYFEELYLASKLIYVRGNHEGFLSRINKIKVKDSYSYVSGNKKILVTHGDKLNTVKWPKWLERFLDNLYHKNKDNQFLIWLKQTKLNYMNYLSSLVVQQNPEFDVICIGHNHCPAIEEIEDTIVCNSGAWVDVLSCTYLVEKDGNFTLNYYA